MSALSSPPRLWSSEQERAVAAMLIDGLSASAIAARFALTRNAVIGRISRNPALHKYVRPAPPKRPKPARVPRFNPIKDIPVIAHKELPAPKPVEPYRQQPKKPMPLIDTGNRYCKWPIEDNDAVLGGILCCGRPVSFGEVYCRPHLEAAHPRRPG